MQEFKYEATTTNESLRQMQTLFFQVLNEVQDDYNSFERLSHLLEDHIDKREKGHLVYEQLYDWKFHLKNNPQTIPLLDSLKLMRAHIYINSWELACDKVSHMTEKGKNIFERKWMLTDGYMETIVMSFFAKLVHLVPSKLRIIEVDE